jgi:hypothetical protein
MNCVVFTGLTAFLGDGGVADLSARDTWHGLPATSSRSAIRLRGCVMDSSTFHACFEAVILNCNVTQSQFAIHTGLWGLIVGRLLGMCP